MDNINMDILDILDRKVLFEKIIIKTE